MSKKLTFATDYCGFKASELEDAKRELLQNKKTSILGSDLFYDGMNFHSFYDGQFEFCIKAEFTEKNIESIIVLSLHFDEEDLFLLTAKTFRELNSYMLEFEREEEKFFEILEQEELEMM